MKNPVENLVHDMTSPGFGNTCEASWGQSEGLEFYQAEVQGCMTPLPRAGDYILNPDRGLHRFRTVSPMRNPSDGFRGVIDKVPIRIPDDGDPLPSWEEVEKYMRTATIVNKMPESFRQFFLGEQQ